MKTKKKRAILAGVAIFAMLAITAPLFAWPEDRNLPSENEPFWIIFAQMDSPGDTTDCVAAATSYVNSQNFPEEQKQGEISGYTQMCSEFSNMPSEMQSDMASEGVATNLFDSANTDWHHINNLYFQKTENGELKGRISFSETIDFMSYDFMSFMSNFGNMVQFNDGYISLNASMVPQMANFGATLTMYGLDQFNEQPDIYVGTGASMKKAVEGQDLSGIVWDATAKTLSFTPTHFSSFRAVQQGSKVKTMKISSVKKSSIKYKTGKTFKLTIKGKNLYKKGSDVSCTLGFQQAEKVRSAKNGKKVTCTYGMDSFTQGSTYPLTFTIAGTGEVTKTNAVRMK